MIAQPVATMEKVELTRRRFSVDEFMRLAEAGILAEDDRVELIWGEIVEMSPINVAHASTVDRIAYLLSKALGGQVILRIQGPVQLSKKSLPQPDITVLKARDDFYRGQHPRPEDTLLLIEVSDSTISYDQAVKGPLYGAAGIADYWIVNLQARQVEVYREPRPNGYRALTIYTPGDTLSPLAFPDVALDIEEILGKED